MALKKCDCKNLFQDKRYGKGIRVMNKLKREGDRPQSYRCTVCGKERE